MGHDVLVANVRELRAISHSDRKSDQVDAEKLARFARLDPKILRPIAHRTVAQQETLTLIRARSDRPSENGGGERADWLSLAGTVFLRLRRCALRSAACRFYRQVWFRHLDLCWSRLPI
jgi:hypothetical protein